MTTRLRWLTVLVVGVVIVAGPVVVRSWPAQASRISATELRERIADSVSSGWSGEVRTSGTLQIPDTESFADIARLLGEESTLRVWWRSSTQWRVDRVRTTGESDLTRDGGRITSWDFESRDATVSPYSSVRLPDDSDLLPPRLATRLLAGAQADELSRLPARRIAGHDAPGLRLVPSDGRSTIGTVDVWADETTGLPLRVEVDDRSSARPVVTTRFTRVSLDTPDVESTRFLPGKGIRVRSRDSLDVAAGANAFAPFELPDTVTGLARRGEPGSLGAVGLYGRGPTAIAAVPLRRRLVGQVRDQLTGAAGARDDDAGTALQVGPLSVLLTAGGRGRGTFLLAGTVTPETLVDAADELGDGTRLRDEAP